MADEPRPDLKLDPLPGGSPAPKRVGGVGLLLVVVIVLQGIVLYRLFSPAPPTAATPKSTPSRELAAALEDKSLAREAAREWERYLEQAPDDPDSPQIYYRAGRLRMDAGDYGEAVRDLVAAEQAAKKHGVELPEKLSTRIVECLRNLGLHGEVGRELSRRVNVGGGEGTEAKVVAMYAGEKITEADLDRMVERRVDRMLTLQGGGDETRRQAILKQLNTPDRRRSMLQEFLRAELFARRAREEGLDKEESFRDALREMEGNILASRFIERELEKVKPTAVDVESAWEANKESYREPEKARVSVIPLKKEEKIPEIKDADAFRAEAKKRESPERHVSRGAPDPMLGDVEPVFALEKGKWTEKPLAKGDDRFLILVEERIPSRLPPLDEVRDAVTRDYVSRKRAELSERITRDLMIRYKVKLSEQGGQK